ncbi:MAG: phosphoadenylyl-sulfate reductase [Sinobacteraceae bacterium]|nr:phosphoadenylyl-sulfate reductase [Nevskiaceae bacterium]MCP5466240.1 phosphoadenylyl-sulfate reductase [Nevskiaceae bacterium]MCP5471642.1 phosphoadenylyl-sulfate reductase [Nevskiaceae bacterium]
MSAPVLNLEAQLRAATQDPDALQALSQQLEALTPPERIEWALASLPGPFVLPSSFGAQAAVALHMVTQIDPKMPVVLVDTQFLFPETWQFVTELQRRLGFDLRIYRSPLSATEFEAQYGRSWEQGAEALQQYNEIMKLEPFRRALRELGVGTWFSGLRRAQSRTRRGLPVLQRLDGRFKVHPIVDWTNRDVGRYLRHHDLPHHPLWERGYVSIGDWHSTRTLAEAGDAELTRFNGLKRECGLHGLEG